MRDNSRPDKDGIVDAELSAIYQATANTRSPRDSDDRILQLAARQAESAKGGPFLTAWLRPLTFAATVGLSIALLLEVSEVDVFRPVQDLSAPTAQGGDAAEPGTERPARTAPDGQQLRDAAGTAREQLRAVDADEAASLRAMPGSGQAPETAPVEAGAAVKQRLAADREEAGEIQERIEATSPGALRSDTARDATEAGCTAQQRQNRDSWLACIAALESAGLSAAAEAERADLLHVFPQRPAQ